MALRKELIKFIPNDVINIIQDFSIGFEFQNACRDGSLEYIAELFQRKKIVEFYRDTPAITQEMVNNGYKIVIELNHQYLFDIFRNKKAIPSLDLNEENIQCAIKNDNTEFIHYLFTNIWHVKEKEQIYVKMLDDAFKNNSMRILKYLITYKQGFGTYTIGFNPYQAYNQEWELLLKKAHEHNNTFVIDLINTRTKNNNCEKKCLYAYRVEREVFTRNQDYVK